MGTHRDFLAALPLGTRARPRARALVGRRLGPGVGELALDPTTAPDVFRYVCELADPAPARTWIYRAEGLVDLRTGDVTLDALHFLRAVG